MDWCQMLTEMRYSNVVQAITLVRSTCFFCTFIIKSYHVQDQSIPERYSLVLKASSPMRNGSAPATSRCRVPAQTWHGLKRTWPQRRCRIDAEQSQRLPVHQPYGVHLERVHKSCLQWRGHCKRRCSRATNSRHMRLDSKVALLVQVPALLSLMCYLGSRDRWTHLAAQNLHAVNGIPELNHRLRHC